jgi:hypothetical protein
MSYLEDPLDQSNTPREFRIGDKLSVRSFDSKLHEGIVDTIEWSTTFKTWCYRLVGGIHTPYWVYQKTNHDSHQFDVVYSRHRRSVRDLSPLEQRLRLTSFARRALAVPPRPLPPPIAISE